MTYVEHTVLAVDHDASDHDRAYCMTCDNRAADEQTWCTHPDCFMPASVLIHGVPYCTADGRDANGGSL